MKIPRLAALVVIAGPWLSSHAQDQSASRLTAQIKRGQTIALAQCSACHVVAPSQEYPPLLRDPAPSFQSIANRPNVSEKSLQHFVLTTHWDLKTVPITMPNPILSRADARAVIQYLLGLREH